MPRRPDRVSHPIFHRQFLVHLPTILSKPIECSGDPRCNRLAAKFRIVAERSEQRIPNTGARKASIQETERTVFVGRRRRGRGGELNMVVLARVLQYNAELQGVVTDDLGGVVGPTINESRPRAWIRSIVDRGQTSHG